MTKNAQINQAGKTTAAFTGTKPGHPFK